MPTAPGHRPAPSWPRTATWLVLVVGLVLGATACSGSSSDAEGDDPASTTSAEASTTTTEAAALPAAADTCGGVAGTTAWLDVPDVGRIQTATIGTGETVAIFLHQTDRQGMCGFADYAELLAGEGIRSILVNQCGYGASACEGGAAAGPAGWPTVVAAAVDRARADGATRVVLVGASAGGTLAVATAGADPAPDIDGLVDLSGPITYGPLDSQAVASRVDRPVLVIAAPEDPDGPTAQEVDALVGALSSPAEEVVVADDQPGVHGWALLGEDGAWTTYAERVATFVRGG